MNNKVKRRLVLIVKSILDGIILIAGVTTLERIHELDKNTVVFYVLALFMICLLLLNHYIFLVKLIKKIK